MKNTRELLNRQWALLERLESAVMEGNKQVAYNLNSELKVIESLLKYNK